MLPKRSWPATRAPRDRLRATVDLVGARARCRRSRRSSPAPPAPAPMVADAATLESPEPAPDSRITPDPASPPPATAVASAAAVEPAEAGPATEPATAGDQRQRGGLAAARRDRPRRRPRSEPGDAAAHPTGRAPRSRRRRRRSSAHAPRRARIGGLPPSWKAGRLAPRRQPPHGAGRTGRARRVGGACVGGRRARSGPPELRHRPGRARRPRGGRRPGGARRRGRAARRRPGARPGACQPARRMGGDAVRAAAGGRARS